MGHKQSFQRGIGHILLILLLIAVTALAVTVIKKHQDLTGILQNQASVLTVVEATPQGQDQSGKSIIRIEFNLPVTDHHAQPYFEMSPTVEGVLSQGSSPNEITFTPSQPFSPGSYVQVTLRAGLPSDKGKKLLQDYNFSFSVSQSENTISFVSHGWRGKFMSFDQRTGSDVTMSIGQFVKNPKVTVFKATPALLLESLTYENDDETYQRSGYYIEKPIDTKNLPVVVSYPHPSDGQSLSFKADLGIYLIQAYDDDKVINTSWIAFNQTGIHLRQDDQKLIVAAQDLTTGQSVSDIKLTAYKLKAKPTVLSQNTVSDIQEIPFPYNQRLDLVIAQKDNDTMVIPVAIPNSQAEIQRYQDVGTKRQIMIYTDRPIYKPGDKVSFRGIVRIDNDALYKVPPIGEKIRIFNPRYSEAEQKVVYNDQFISLGEGGTFSGELTIPKDAGNSTESIYASSNLDKTITYSDAFAYYDVAQYIKPTFGLDLTTSTGEVTKGSTVDISLSGSYFDGRPYANQKVKYSIYRKDFYETESKVSSKAFNLNRWGGMCGGGGFGGDYFGEQIGEDKEITLDGTGRAKVSFDTKQIDPGISQEITFVMRKNDTNDNEIISAQKTVVHTSDIKIFSRPGPYWFTSGSPISAGFYVEDLQGKELSGQKLPYVIYDLTYDQNSLKSSQNVLKQGTLTTNAQGLAYVTDTLSSAEDNSYYIEIQGQDNRGNKTVLTQSIGIRGSAVDQNTDTDFFNNGSSQGILKITSDKTNLTPQTQASLTIESPQDLTAFVTFERGRIYDPQWLTLKKGKNTFTFAVPDAYMPSISPTFSVFANGRYSIEGLSLNVPAMKKVITVTVTPDKLTYAKNDTMQLTISTVDASGAPVSANVGVGIVDKAIYALRKNATPPLHSSFYFFRGRSTNTSSSLSWIALFDLGGKGGGGGGGGATGSKDVDTLYWNPVVTTGADGKATLSIPLGKTITTWKILVYASTNDTKLGQGEAEFLVK